MTIDTNDLREKITIKGLDVVADTDILEILDRLEAAEQMVQDYLRIDMEKAQISQRLEAAEKGRDELLAGFDEWLDKTKWVQQGVNEGMISAKYLGLHRADVMTSLLGEAEKERDALRAAVRHEADCVEACKSEIDRLRAENAGLVDDMNLLRDNNTSLRAKIAEMEQQEPAGEVVHNGESAGLYDILEQGALLYALPGAQNVPKEAIAKILTEVMNIAVANGADSRSMPDEYVEVAAWLCGIPAQPAPSVPREAILSDRVRAGVEAAPWVVDEIRRLEAWMDAAKHALHQISLCSQNSMSGQLECGRIARAALTPAPSGGAERKSCGSCKHWIDKRRIGDKEGSGSCDRIPMQWQAEPGDALAFVTDGELYFAQLRTMPSFCCAHYEAITPSAESSSTSPAGHAAAQTASDPP